MNEYKPYQELAAAICQQAMADYVDALMVLAYSKTRKYKAIRKKSRLKNLARDLERAEEDVWFCEKFFRGDWFKLLMPNTDGEVIIELLKGKASNGERLQKQTVYKEVEL